MTSEATGGSVGVRTNGGRFAFSLAGPQDDADVRRLLREPFGTTLRLALTREPDASRAAELLGARHQGVVARERTSGRAVAMGFRSIGQRFVGGRPQAVGYLGEMRVTADRRGSPTLVRGGFRVMRRLHDEDGTTRLYFVSVAADNRLALRLFEAGLPDLPACRPLGELVTLTLRARPSSGVSRGLELRRATAADRVEILACLERHGRRRDLAPCWSAADLDSPARTPGLRSVDFWLAARSGRVVGCAALWDQRAFKQVVVSGYGPWRAATRPGLNALLRLRGRPTLPPAGSTLAQAFVSPCAVDDDDPEVLRALLEVLRGEAAARALTQVVLGMDARDPLMTSAGAALPAWRYHTRLLGLAWAEDRERLDDWRPALLGPDVALL